MAADASWLHGKRVFAVSVGAGLADAVVDGVADLGAEVTRLGGDLDLASAASVAAGIDAAVAAHGAPDLVVLSVIPTAAMRPDAIDAMAEADWREAAIEGLRTTMRLLQALGPHMKPHGGAIVFVAPSLSLVGTPRMIALSTLLEGQRGLMKSVARQWGASGVTLNWIAAAPRALAPFDGVALAARPDAVTIALGRAPDPRTEIAPLLGYLGGDAGRAITGATLMLDGGEWMVP
ncbi:MAG: SDR family oxidoreductase [Hydrogenophilaceae bacterium]|nr:SDR family oxidoreductase [Hydrogenophilaceae bacterium]